MAVGRAAWELMFQLSPIMLTGGALAAQLPSWLPGVPITAATALGTVAGIAASAAGGSGLALPTSLDDAFAQFQPMPGGTVLDQQIATYPFANQQVAANSVIQQPCRMSFQMICPARGPLSYWTKLAAMEAMIQALYLHNQNGGTYTLLTPSYIYFNCLMRNMRDTSSGQTKQVQNIWTLDFEQPLLTVEQAGSAIQRLNGMLTDLDAGTQVPAATVQGQANPAVTGAFNAPSGGAASP
jgi:hypothetical protein